jgi:SNF2 family DNA or RNA helicase
VSILGLVNPLASTDESIYSIVSYQEVSRHFPSKKVRDDLQNHSGSVEDWKEGYDENLGPLFKIPFWRIVLDEAHNIKNKDSQSK